MVKIGNKSLDIDQSLNMAVGCAQIASSAVSVIAPEKVGNCAITILAPPNNPTMTRFGGAFGGAAGAHSVMAALGSSASRNKDALKVNAVQCGLVTGAAVMGRNGDIKEERSTATAVVAGVATLGLAYRAFCTPTSSGTVSVSV